MILTSLEEQAQSTPDISPSASRQRLPANNAPAASISHSTDTHRNDEEAIRQERDANERALRESRESVWFLKEIIFNGQTKNIITQNRNGPCSFIAICNILILRGDIQIHPPERTSVSYDFLAQLVGEYLLSSCPGVDLSAALTMMPLTQRGMDLNPLFTSPTAFRPAGDAGALKLFEQARIPLIHGWVVDPDSTEYAAISTVEDYDSAVNLIVEVDHLTKGQFVVDEDSPPIASSSKIDDGVQWSKEDRQKVENAWSVQHFLETTRSQLTYYGLFSLASTIEPGSLAALFRNSHLSVLHRRPYSKSDAITRSNLHHRSDTDEGKKDSSSISANSDAELRQTENFIPNQPKVEDVPEEDSALYSLVTDVVFYNEPSVVWERLEDIDGGGSVFVDSFFRRSSPVGGDFAGHTAETLLAQREPPTFDPADQELARKLQDEEDAQAQEIHARRSEQQRSTASVSRHTSQWTHQQQVQDPRYPHNSQRVIPAEALFDETLLQQTKHGKTKRKNACAIQ